MGYGYDLKIGEDCHLHPERQASNLGGTYKLPIQEGMTFRSPLSRKYLGGADHFKIV
jgi:hypothetical protein